jgi:hypothetical protein
LGRFFSFAHRLIRRVERRSQLPETGVFSFLDAEMLLNFLPRLPTMVTAAQWVQTLRGDAAWGQFSSKHARIMSREAASQLRVSRSFLARRGQSVARLYRAEFGARA